MIPGLTSKMSEAAISLATTNSIKTDIVRVTSTATTTVAGTFIPNFGGGFSGMFILINQSGANMTTVTSGNIQTAVTIGQNVATLFVYSRAAGKWFPGALA